jgi:hypothetical protein
MVFCAEQIKGCVSRKGRGSVFKECNIKRHYDACHKEKYDLFQVRSKPINLKLGTHQGEQW